MTDRDHEWMLLLQMAYFVEQLHIRSDAEGFWHRDVCYPDQGQCIDASIQAAIRTADIDYLQRWHDRTGSKRSLILNEWGGSSLSGPDLVMRAQEMGTAAEWAHRPTEGKLAPRKGLLAVLGWQQRKPA